MFNLGASWRQKVPVLGHLFTSVRNSSYLGKLAPNDGAVFSYKRLGRGQASGKGKTAGRGQKGQKARGKAPNNFEGGQTPYYKRFPIIGFRRPHRPEYHELNLERIQTFWNNGRIPLKEGETLTIKTMRECGLITGSLGDGVKLLSMGRESYNVPLNIEASKASIAAIKAIENLNCSYKSVYFTSLALRAHVNPDLFYLKKGYLPLPARPTHRRDIEYYSNSRKRGYLLDNRELLLDHLGKRETSKKVVQESPLLRQLHNASDKPRQDFSQNTDVSVNEL